MRTTVLAVACLFPLAFASQCFAQGGPGCADLAGELALGGQAGARGVGAADDRLDQLLEHRVDRGGRGLGLVGFAVGGAGQGQGSLE